VPAAGAALDKVNAVVARLEKRLYDQALRTGQDIEFPLTPERFAAAFADVLFQCAWAEPGDDGQIHD
jgi:hypothetical protein